MIGMACAVGGSAFFRKEAREWFRSRTDSKSPPRRADPHIGHREPGAGGGLEIWIAALSERSLSVGAGAGRRSIRAQPPPPPARGFVRKAGG